MTSFAVVGAGRAGGSMWRALNQSGWRPHPHPGPLGRHQPPTKLAHQVEVIVVAVPDDAIASVAASITPGPACIVHLSGAKDLAVLAPHQRRASVHPLMSLPDPETGAQRLQAGGVFAIDGDQTAHHLVRALGGRGVAVPGPRRALYHATAAVAANHLVVLCAQVERLAATVGVPVDAYWDLMSTTFENVRHTGAVSSLTGPAARGDDSTLALHLDALPPDELDLYLTLARGATLLAGREVPPALDGAPMTSPNPSPSPTASLAATGQGPILVSTVAELRDRLDAERAAGRTVGFVPTMGYLHDGHASLMRAAAAANDVVVASIFVNPLQFAPEEDLAAYPRDLARDAEVAAEAGVGILFVPPVEEMYPHGEVLTTVTVGEISARWEGASRPTHFAGVATVVSKLFNVAGNCTAYFGEKDYQQLAVINQMVTDLSIPVTVVGCPIVREPDGLARSSRNVYLSPEDRAAAVVLRRALSEGERLVAAGERSTATIDAAMASVVAAEPRAELDYAAVVEARTLTQAPTITGEIRLLIAARLGSTRLIDNSGASVPPPDR